MGFDFNEEKNQLLLRERGVTFQAVIESVLNKGVLATSLIPMLTVTPISAFLLWKLTATRTVCRM
jgi:hypothetical protein